MKPKAEALAALAEIARSLADPSPIVGLSRAHLTATVAYAIEQVTAISETKRPRKAKDATA